MFRNINIIYNRSETNETNNTNGYLWNSFVYLGSKGITTKKRRAMERLIEAWCCPKLMSDLSGKGYKLFVDN